MSETRKGDTTLNFEVALAELPKPPSRDSVKSTAQKSVISTTSSKKRQRKIQHLELTNEVNEKYEGEFDQYEEKIDEIKVLLTSPNLVEESRQNLEQEMKLLEVKQKHLMKKWNREIGALQKKTELEIEKLTLLEEEEQVLDDKEEDIAKNFVYPDARADVPLSRSVERSEEIHQNFQPDDRPHDKRKVCQSFIHDDKSKGKPFSASETRRDWKYSNCAEDDDVYSYTEETKPSNALGAVDKDALMLQLMQSQMKFLQKSQVSPGDKFLPEFNGDPAQWGNFKAAYDRIIKSYHPDDSEMMMRLQKVLKGQARQVVEHLMANVANVKMIIKTLEFRFGRSEYIIDYLIEKIKSCSKPEAGKPESIVEFGTSVDALVANIYAFKEDDYLSSKQLVNELVEKLPGQMKDEWHIWLEDNGHKKNVANFSQWLQRRVRVAMHRIKPVVNLGGGSSDSTKQRPRRGPGSSNAAIVEDEHEERLQPSTACPACKRKNHSLEKCWVFSKKTVDDRWNLVKEAKVCFSCLQSSHISTACQQKKECGENGCSRNHHKLLHGRSSLKNLTDNSIQRSTPATASAVHDGISGNEAKKEDTAGSIGVAVYIEGTDGPLSIVPLRVKQVNSGKWITTYGLLDSGATRTLISDKLAADMGLQGERTSYAYRNMGGELKINRSAMKVNLDVSGRYRNAKFYPLTEAITVNEIGIQPYSINVDEVKKRWPHLNRMKGENLKKVVPEIVIGTDHGFLMLQHDKLYKSIEDPIAVRTVLGWVIQGKVQESNQCGYCYYVGSANVDDLTHELVKASFKMDELGLKLQDNPMSVEDKKALKILEETTSKHEGRWTTGLLWKSSEGFDSGRNEALTRLWQTERRMKRDPDYAMVYSAKIKEYLQKRFIRKLDAEEAAVVTNRTRYVPHFGVTNPNKPGKFRLVFDAANKAGGKSLNDLLYTGPDLIKPLTSVLMNFRRHPFVLCGDIEDMFHRILIKKEDRSAQRFFWKGNENNREPDTYEMMVMIFGATSSPSSAIYVQNKNALEYEDRFPTAANALVNDCYIDDLLTGGETEEDVIRLRKEVSEINNSGGFNMKKFMSNSRSVLDSIPDELKLEKAKSLDEKSVWDTERVLGLWWQPESDEFTFKLNFHKVDPEVINGRRPTKREVCSLLMSLFDPIGFINQFKIKGMIVLQRIWRSGIGWDDFITDEVYTDWLKWLSEMEKIRHIRIPRCYGIDKAVKSIELHMFADSSAEGYCSVCYYRIKFEDEVRVSFVASRVKVAPLKKATIPRLELQAAFLGTKLVNTILNEVKVTVDRVYFWSDSSTALSWIKNETGRFNVFVASRVGYIQENSNAEDWRWVPTAENVADDGTRCDTSTDLSSESRWLHGPAFLKLTPNEWPKKKDTEGAIAFSAIHENMALDSDYLDGSREEELSFPPFAKYSRYRRLVRATAAISAAAQHWVLKAKKAKNISPPWNKNAHGISSELSPEDLQIAEVRLLKQVQTEICRGCKTGSSKIPLLKNLSWFADKNGLLRVKGRITRAVAPADMKNPIIIPGSHHVADLIVYDEHLRNAHTGKETVFNNIRQKFWITGGRNTVKRCFAKCSRCKIDRAKPVVPEMADLPSYRLASNLPVFSYTGVDFFGPIEVTIGRRHEKRWVSLFTCMVTRATYLDIAVGLSKEDMMHVFSRFVDTHGIPRHMFSDNATNFVALSKEITGADKMSGMKWHFIPPASPHFGGAWERMVRAVKKVLWNILKHRCPREEVLRTTLKAAENIVNCRPLTYVSTDPNDPESLTPNHFLRGAAHCGSSAYFGEGVGDEAEFMRNQFTKTQLYVNEFWDRWSKEVLPDLVRKTKWYDSKEPVRMGDVVLLVDDQQPRNTWVKGVITKTFPGSDGLVRVVEVTTRPPDKKSTIYKRSVAKVAPIGLRIEDSVADSTLKATKSGAGMLEP